MTSPRADRVDPCRVGVGARLTSEITVNVTPFLTSHCDSRNGRGVPRTNLNRA
jgi:hypothetical protein